MPLLPTLVQPILMKIVKKRHGWPSSWSQLMIAVFLSVNYQCFRAFRIILADGRVEKLAVADFVSRSLKIAKNVKKLDDYKRLVAQWKVTAHKNMTHNNVANHTMIYLLYSVHPWSLLRDCPEKENQVSQSRPAY